MSEEAQLLREMILDREQRIALIQLKSKEQLKKEERLRSELDQVNEQSMNNKITYQTEKTRLLHGRATAEERLEDMQRNLRQQGQSLHTYANVIQQEQMGDSSYVMRMQAQLCKAMHSMGIVDHQMELAREHSDSMIKLQKEAVTRTTEEKSQLELQLLNELMKCDTNRKEEEAGLKTKLEDIHNQIETVRAQIEENEEDEDEDTAQQEDLTEEEKETKEELMKELEERKKEVEQLEQETERQRENIQELKERLKNPNAPKKEKSKKDEKTPPSPKKEKKQNLSDAMENVDISHVPLQNEAVLELARKRAAEKEQQGIEKKSSDDEFDLLKAAQARLSGEDLSSRPGSDEEDSDEEESDEEEHFSEAVEEEDERKDKEAVAPGAALGSEKEDMVAAAGDEVQKESATVEHDEGFESAEETFEDADRQRHGDSEAQEVAEASAQDKLMASEELDEPAERN